MAPIAWAVVASITGTVTTAHAHQAFSPAWFAERGAAQSAAASTGYLPSGVPVSALNPTQQQQRANAQLQTSIDNLGILARGIAAQQAAQATARQAAIANDASVPDGLTEGGLKVDTNSLTQGWINANAPTQRQTNGKTTVAVKQTADRAILNWETFNVGKNTVVQFDQQSNWAVLNRVNDPLARPSQIQGQISAPGTVLIANRNGILFTGTSQIDTRNLVAAAANISDSQFRTNGIYSAQTSGGYTPSFTDANGVVTVAAGARINTTPSSSATQGGGYALLLGREVHNAGTVVTPGGQTQLAAGDFFIVRAGQGTNANQFSTTRGNEVAPQFLAGSSAGKVVNTGFIAAPEGDITLAGRNVIQDGVALSTTSVNARGTIHLLNSASDTSGSVTLTGRSNTAVLLSDNGATALDSQRAALITQSAQQDIARRAATFGVFDNLSKQDDRQDQSRVEIVSGGNVDFGNGSVTLATGGQIAVSAGSAGRASVARGATLDVAGAVGVNVAMASNNVQINVQGNEQRDSPLNRDRANLNNVDIWIDRRYLTYVPAGVGGYANERWYTSGGLLEVGGYLGLTKHGVGEWMAQGGSVAFNGGEVVTQSGSSINLSGGSLNVQTGYLNQSWLKGTDGQLYVVAHAPGDMTFTGIYRGFESTHSRWGDNTTEFFATPLIAPQQRLEDGYTVGRDAGRMIVSTRSAVLEGQVAAVTYQGPQQSRSADAQLDGYNQSQRAAASGAQLVLGSYATAPNIDPNAGPLGVFHNLGATFDDIVFSDKYASIADALRDANGNVALPTARQGKVSLDSHLLNDTGWGSILAVGSNRLTVDGALSVLPGGTLSLYAPSVDVNADLSARGGFINVGNVLTSTTGAGKPLDVWLAPGAQQQAGVRLASGVTLDTSGLWSNLLASPDTVGGVPYVNGGKVSVRSTGDVTLAKGSVIDVSSGAAVLTNGTLQGGKGGDITLAAGCVTADNGVPSPTALLTLGGELRAYGVTGGGTLNVQSGTAVGIGGELMPSGGVLNAGQAAPANMRLLEAYTLAAGERAPMDVSVLVTSRPAGYVVAVTRLQIPVGPMESVKSLSVESDWALPIDFAGYVYDAAGNQYQRGQTVPAGTQIVKSFTLSKDYVIPAAVFPHGLPIVPTRAIYAAGDVLDMPVTLAVGTTLGAGAVLARPVQVAQTGVLDPSLFQSGFSRYVVTAGDGVTVLPGTHLDVSMPVLRTDVDSLRTLPTGTRLSTALPVWTPPLYQEDAAHATLTQRGGASLTLNAGAPAGGPGQFSPLVIGQDARVSVDPGQRIDLWSNGGQVTVEGLLQAPGGTVSIASAPAGYLASLTRSIWIGDNAVIDVAGQSHKAYDAQGRAYGVAQDGGTIDIGLSDAFLVIRPGARLEASGTSVDVDASAGSGPLQPAQPMRLASQGGSIGLRSYVGMILDGTFDAHSGGEGAAGGSLTVQMDNRRYQAGFENITPQMQTLHNLTLTQQHQASDMAADARPGQADAALQYGVATLGVDQIRAGGFDALTLASHDLLVFNGDINLSLGRSLNVRNAILAVADSTPNAKVQISAPYIRLDGGSWQGQTGFYSPGIFIVNGGRVARGDSALTLSGNLIDVFGRVQSGVTGLRGDGQVINDPNLPMLGQPVDAGGFALLDLRSEGDVRLNNAALITTDSMAITATQIYPSSGQRGMLLAGFIAPDQGSWNPKSRLILRSNGHTAAVPDSVFGRLVVIAPTIDQGGVLRAPLGTIALNDTGGQLAQGPWFGNLTPSSITRDMQVILRGGSLTSVSAAGLVMPYGGTSDGLTYRGADGTLYSLGSSVVNHVNDGDVNQTDNLALPQGISLGGGSVVAERGSVLDLSGGGELRGAGFISGRGGSVDVLSTPLVNANPLLYRQSRSGNGVYAIVPGYASDYAPLIADKGAGDPAVGRQVTIGAGVPGLPAGTYTLLPASFALMPGAWRVEIGGHTTASAFVSGTSAMPGGSWIGTGTLSTAGTSLRDALPSQLVMTPGKVVRSMSQYDETSYADFAKAQAAQFGNVRPLLPVDGKVLSFYFRQNDQLVPLQLAGDVLLDPAAGGVRGQVSVQGNKPIDIVAGDAQPTVGAIALSADSLSALRASTLTVGGYYIYLNGQQGGSDSARIFFQTNGLSDVVNVGSGATLRAGQIFLVGKQVNVDSGATLDTRGMGQPAVDSNNGFLFANSPGASGAAYAPAVLAVSNGWLDILPAIGTGTINVGDGASLLTQGTIAFAAPGALSLGNANFGARYMSVSQNQINIGTAASLDAARAAGTMQPGWQLTQETLDRLLRPSSTLGVPALERLSLTAGGAFNFYGGVTLDTGNSAAQMVFNTPAFYGLGGAGDVVRIATRDFVWNGIATGNGTTTSPYTGTTPVAVQPGGPGTGVGSLVIDAQRIAFGYDALGQPQRQAELGRWALGFGDVTVKASKRVSANSRGSLSVGLSQDADGTLHGGALSIVTPLLTGQAGSSMRYQSGGAISVSAPQGVTPSNTADVGELGATLALRGTSVSVDTAVALPSGVLKINADGDITLGNQAQIDLSGRAVGFYDITKYSWGGDANLTTSGGNIVQSDGARIDVSAKYNNAGSVVLNASQGTVTLNGGLAASGGAGFASGRFALTEATTSDAAFSTLNRQLDQASFNDARAFVFKHGDLTVRDTLRARQVSIATDGGSLTVDGTIDTSGKGAGSIDLAARDNLTLTGQAILDAHGKTLVTDGHGAAIDASNRPKVSLSAVDGAIRLDTGATIDVRSADDVARGRIEINAPRLGGTGNSATGADAPDHATGNDVAISASGPLKILGARSIALNAVARYHNAPVDPSNANNQIINQAYLELIDRDSQAFDTGARSNADLQGRLAGLTAFGAAFHLRPGVEIDSRTANGTLTVQGDLDLSGYRYGPNADRSLTSSTYGAGEPMALTLRAGGDLTILGSINDGFVPPPATPDDTGWKIHDQVFVTGQPAQGGTYVIPYNPDMGGNYYMFPAVQQGGEVHVVSGSVTDDFGTYDAGATIDLGFLGGTVIVSPGTVLGSNIAGGADVLLAGNRPDPGRMWAVSKMMAPGSLSASIRLVSGADLAAVDTRRLQTAAQLAGTGNMVLNDLHVAASQSDKSSEAPSVIRTGTGDLDLYVGGNYSQKTLYGVYTAGTAIPTAQSADYNAPRALNADGSVLGAGNAAYEPTLNNQRMWFTTDGGDFVLSAQGNITGYLQPETLSVGDWLWRQGGAAIGQRTAWGVNFGSYVADGGSSVAQLGLSAFAGVGALGGGNARVQAGGDIGESGNQWHGLLAVVGGSGRVDTSGQLLQTGGGTLDISAGGKISGGLYANLRGDTVATATDVGSLVLTGIATPNTGDPRAVDSHTAYSASRQDAVNFAPGDGALRINTRGDLVVGRLVDPGRVGERSETQASNGTANGPASTWFTLWTDRSALDLFSAGGNISPLGDANTDVNVQTDLSNTTRVIPATLSAVAAGGSIYYSASSDEGFMMPSSTGHLDLLARGLVSGNWRNGGAGASNQPIGPLGAAASTLATPWNVAWRISDNPSGTSIVASNYWGSFSRLGSSDVYDYGLDAAGKAHVGRGGNLFMFGPNTVSDASAAGAGIASHIYAVNGDVLGVQFGNIDSFDTGVGGQTVRYYQASKPLRMFAGGDIVNSSGLIVQSSPTDISMLAAQGGILYTNFSVAGPGTLEVSAGNQVYQGDSASLTSLGPVAPGDLRPGADIVVQTGIGRGAPGQGASDFATFARRYLDPANSADPSRALAEQPGKVAKTYDTELANWLKGRFGYVAASATDALGYFMALAPEQQRVFLREVYYAELTAGGREYNDPSSKRFGSYLRGRDAIATLFPARDAAGAPLTRGGDLTLFQGRQSNAGIRTIGGGAIQLLTPSGKTTLGVGSIAPTTDPKVAPAGLITQGAGDIQIYSQGSILLGLSRVMTTFGGNILAWSAGGDINAGRGTKTTLVYTPPKREYDALGNVAMSPNAPSAGAGIATLAPIAEVPPGDVDLIAPLGTIDAGEAGIRVSGNVNVAALQVINAANIQVQGKSTGLPVIAAVNVGALTNASAAASSAAGAAQDAIARDRAQTRQNQPSLFTVRMLESLSDSSGSGRGGNRTPATSTQQQSYAPHPYDKSSLVQVVGLGGAIDARQWNGLTDEERRLLAQER